MESLDLMTAGVYLWFIMVIGFIIACCMAIFTNDN
jgi:hypothetical protein